jgi:hypothetical protein
VGFASWHDDNFGTEREKERERISSEAMGFLTHTLVAQKGIMNHRTASRKEI